jgi:KUP system potassium uptake protein
LVAVGASFLGVEVLYFAANLTKIVHGGWLPLVIAALVITVMTTWQRGRKLVTARRIDLEGPLDDFVEEMHGTPMTRVPGCAVFPHPTKQTTPLALRANVDFNHVLHEHVLVVSVQAENVPHIPVDEQLSVDDLGYTDDGIVHLTVRYGFQDEQDIPGAVRAAAGMTDELDIDPDEASYFLSRISIVRSKRPGMSSWRKRLFIGLAHNAATPAAYFHLPEERTVVMGSHVEL